MSKLNYGPIINMDGESKDIIVNSTFPNKIKDLGVGLLLIASGVIYLTKTAFKNGYDKFEEAEYKTMVDLGIISDVDEK